MLLENCNKINDLLFEEVNGLLKIYNRKEKLFDLNFTFNLNDSLATYGTVFANNLDDSLPSINIYSQSHFSYVEEKINSPKLKEECLHKKINSHKIEEITCQVINVNNNLKKLNNYVGEFKDLKDNWDGYGAIPIYPEIVKKVQWFLRILPNEYLSFIDVGEISPCSNGTIVLDFENENDGILSISFGRHYENFYFDIENEKIDESEKCYINPDNGIPVKILDYIKSLFSNEDINSRKVA